MLLGTFVIRYRIVPGVMRSFESFQRNYEYVYVSV